jgi:hypothetical protein
MPLGLANFIIDKDLIECDKGLALGLLR